MESSQSHEASPRVSIDTKKSKSVTELKGLFGKVKDGPLRPTGPQAAAAGRQKQMQQQPSMQRKWQAAIGSHRVAPASEALPKQKEQQEVEKKQGEEPQEGKEREVQGVGGSAGPAKSAGAGEVPSLSSTSEDGGKILFEKELEQANYSIAFLRAQNADLRQRMKELEKEQEKQRAPQKVEEVARAVLSSRNARFSKGTAATAASRGDKESAEEVSKQREPEGMESMASAAAANEASASAALRVKCRELEEALEQERKERQRLEGETSRERERENFQLASLKAKYNELLAIMKKERLDMEKVKSERVETQGVGSKIWRRKVDEMERMIAQLSEGRGGKPAQDGKGGRRRESIDAGPAMDAAKAATSAAAGAEHSDEPAPVSAGAEAKEETDGEGGSGQPLQADGEGGASMEELQKDRASEPNVGDDDEIHKLRVQLSAKSIMLTRAEEEKALVRSQLEELRAMVQKSFGSVRKPGTTAKEHSATEADQQPESGSLSRAGSMEGQDVMLANEQQQQVPLVQVTVRLTMDKERRRAEQAELHQLRLALASARQQLVALQALFDGRGGGGGQGGSSHTQQNDFWRGRLREKHFICQGVV